MTLLPLTALCDRVQFAPEERQLLRSLFLRRFGLEDLIATTQTPPSDSSSLPDYIWDLYDQAEEEQLDLIRHYYPSTVMPVHERSVSGWLLRYNLTATGRSAANERVLHADLRLKLTASNNFSRGLRVNVYEWPPSGGDLRLIDSKSLLPARWTSRWTDFDVTDSVRRVPNDVDSVIFVLQNVPVENADVLRSSAALVTYSENVSDDDEGERQSNWQPRRRKRRSTAPRTGGRKHRKHRKHHVTPKDNTQCRRSELYVDFSELNWQDWIMAPVGYDAYQCSGRCPHPLPSHLNTTNHAIIQSLINSIDPGAVPPPSCVPTEMSSISILYRDVNDVVVVKTYPDMKVEACGCH